MAFPTSYAPDVQTISDLLVNAHMTGRAVDSAAAPVPCSLDCAMQVQAVVQKKLGKPACGWKVAIGPESMPIAAPLYDVHSQAAKIRLFHGCTIEVELAVRLCKDLHRLETGSYNRSDILEAIESVVLGIEVIGGRFAHATQVPFLSFLADNLGNSSYVVGESVPATSLKIINGLECHVTLNGQTLYRAPASHPAGDPLLPLLAYANAQNDFMGGLKAGQIVTTGSLCGVLPINAAGLLEGCIAKVGHVSVNFQRQAG